MGLVGRSRILEGPLPLALRRIPVRRQDPWHGARDHGVVGTHSARPVVVRSDRVHCRRRQVQRIRVRWAAGVLRLLRRQGHDAANRYAARRQIVSRVAFRHVRPLRGEKTYLRDVRRGASKTRRNANEKRANDRSACAERMRWLGGIQPKAVGTSRLHIPPRQWTRKMLVQ